MLAFHILKNDQNLIREGQRWVGNYTRTFFPERGIGSPQLWAPARTTGSRAPAPALSLAPAPASPAAAPQRQPRAYSYMPPRTPQANRTRRADQPIVISDDDDHIIISDDDPELPPDVGFTQSEAGSGRGLGKPPPSSSDGGGMGNIPRGILAKQNQGRARASSSHPPALPPNSFQPGVDVWVGLYRPHIEDGHPPNLVQAVHASISNNGRVNFHLATHAYVEPNFDVPPQTPKDGHRTSVAYEDIVVHPGFRNASYGELRHEIAARTLGPASEGVPTSNDRST